MSSSHGIDDVLSGHGRHENQWLTFILDGQEYGIDILRVQEIKGWTPATTIPNAPAHVRGVINLRGTIVPIVDLRAQFGLEAVPYDKFTVVIVVSVEMEGVKRVMGMVVDAVSDVVDVPPGDLKDAPEIGSGPDSRFLKGIATVRDSMVIALDVDRLLDVRTPGLSPSPTRPAAVELPMAGVTPAHA